MNAGGSGPEMRDPASSVSISGLVHAGVVMSRPVKRSFTISGHRTSISLETAFWEALKAIAAEERLSVAALISRIDAARGKSGLSSAVRVWILQHYCESARRNRA
ncbi:MAG TPA: ribbon-helix-helix domain-containing protein [Hyphomicrobiaceae bacterium]|nr:ribbon-helix-helix domain-containing protein [Hyphomicrobiaceae bacterium]